MANPMDFAKQYGAVAKATGDKLGVDPAILLGQWGLETGFGKSVVPGTNNLGNIKDFSGGGVAATDNMTGSNDKYQKFDTPQAFADHYADLIQRKYPDAVGAGSDAVKFAKALKGGGYAEDPLYVNKIVNVTNTVRKQPGLLDMLAAAVFPAAQAGELPNPKKVSLPPDVLSSLKWEPVPPAGAPGKTVDLPPDVLNSLKWEPIDTTAPDHRSFVEKVGDNLLQIPRQVGLTARYGLEGLGQAAQVATEPIRRLVVNPAARALGLPEAKASGDTMASVADSLGLPSPKGANERVIGDITRLMAGSGGIAGGAKALAKGATGAAESVLQGLSANPGGQIASAAGAGGAGGAVREAGGDPASQAIASLAGGLAGPIGLNAGEKVMPAIKARLPIVGTAAPQKVEQQIQLTMQRAGVDWSQVPESVRQQVRTEVSDALKGGGELNADAVRRLTDFARVEGATPTRGTLTLDPVQITREKNLAKSAANSSDRGLQGLARIENENNSALIKAVNSAGADTTDDAYSVGQRAIDHIQGGIDQRKAGVDTLYAAARDSAGRSLPLDGAAFANRVIPEIDQAMVGGALPAGVRDHINKISRGEVPFTVEYAEQLKTAIGKLQRSSSDGQTRYALGIVRNALDDTPLLSTQGGPGPNIGRPLLPNETGQLGTGEEAINAFNQARAANRSMMQWVESSPAIKAIYEGTATPDTFVQKYLLGSGVSFKDMSTLKRAVSASPEALQSIRSYVTAWLKDKALGGAADEVGNFSASNYNKALKAIGPQKLGVFFDPQEIEQLRAIGRVGSYTTFQPRGSAVNNSNSGALMLGRGLDFLDSLSSKVPLFGVGPTIQGVIRGTQQGVAQRVAPALINPAPRLPLSSAAIPASVYSSLFGLSAIPPRQDDRRP